ncbi:MAG: hypothetical protein FWJ74_02350 [Gemmatimonadota bacterium]
MVDRRQPAQAAEELRDRTRELIEEELDRLGEAGGGDPSMTEAVEMGLLKARELGLEAGLEPELVDEVTRDTARRMIADAQHGRGRRSAKKSRHTTQILRESEGRGDWLGRPEPGPEDEQRGEAWRDQGSRP